MIRVTVNGETAEIRPGDTVKDLLERFKIPGGRVACEVNMQIVRRADHVNTVLKEGDIVEIVQMIGGG